MTPTVSQTMHLTEREPVTYGHLVFDPACALVLWKGVRVKLTVTEMLLLNLLTQAKGRIQARDDIADKLYDERDIDFRTIDSHMKRLRKKFRQMDPQFNQIETIYGMGYRWPPENETVAVRGARLQRVAR